MITSKKQIHILIITTLMLSTTGCVTNLKESWDENAGKIVGGVAGAAAGYIACDGDAKCAVIGAVVGVGLGALWDNRQEQLAALAEEKHIVLQTTKVETFNKSGQSGLELSINEPLMFKSGSQKLTKKSKSDLIAVADIYKAKPKPILIIGHTDASGSSKANQALSEQRAKNVAKLFASQGIPQDQLFFQGAGESQPIANNDTAEGRSSNRRVEIIEVADTETLAAYSMQRSSDSRFLANSNKTATEKKSVKKQIAVAEKSTKTISSVATVTPELKVAVPQILEDNAPIAKTEAVNKNVKVDFLGKPAQQDIASIITATGDQVDDSFSFFSKAHASDRLSPCYMNSPRLSGAVQNLASGQTLDLQKELKLDQQLSQSDYWPGINGSVWLDNVGNNLVAIKGLKIHAKSGSTMGEPETLVYDNYNGRNSKISYRNPVHIEAYKGVDGLLLRGYFDDQSPIQCMDVVMANNSMTTSKAGVLYYNTNNGLYEKKVNFHRINK